MHKQMELRDDFRDFRLDRIASPTALDRTFPEEPGRRWKTSYIE